MDSISSFLVRQIWPAASANRLGDRLINYLRTHALTALGLGEETADLEEIEAPEGGVGRRWRSPSKGGLIIRAWPWDGDKKLVQEYVTVSELFEKAGLKVPKIHLSDDSFATMRKWRLEAVVHEAPVGEPLDARGAGDLKALEEFARQLALLHRQTGVQWGKPWRPKNILEKPREYWAARLKKFRTRVNTQTSRLLPAQIERGIGQLEKRAEAIELGFPVLLHGELHRRKVYVSPEGALTWTGFASAQYGMPEYDLALARNGLLGAEAFKHFWNAYSQAMRGERELNKDAVTTFGIFLLWERLNANIKEQLSLREKRESDDDSKARLKELEAQQRPIEEMISRVIVSEK